MLSRVRSCSSGRVPINWKWLNKLWWIHFSAHLNLIFQNPANQFKECCLGGKSTPLLYIKKIITPSLIHFAWSILNLWSFPCLSKLRSRIARTLKAFCKIRALDDSWLAFLPDRTLLSFFSGQKWLLCHLSDWKGCIFPLSTDLRYRGSSQVLE